MIVEQEKAQCARDGCRCEVPSGQKYCGPHCAEAAVSPEVHSEERCQCGHDGCKSSIA